MKQVCCEEFITQSLNEALLKNSKRNLNYIYREMDRQNGFTDVEYAEEERTDDWWDDDYEDEWN